MKTIVSILAVTALFGIAPMVHGQSTTAPDALPQVEAKTTDTSLVEALHSEVRFNIFSRWLKQSGLESTLVHKASRKSVAGDQGGPMLADPQFDYTILAPTDDAIGRMPNDVFKAIESNPSLLKKLVRLHIVRHKLQLSGLHDGAKLRTLLGQNLIVSGSTDSPKVDGASIAKDRITANNGFIYTIDTVLVPDKLMDGVKVTP